MTDLDEMIEEDSINQVVFSSISKNIKKNEPSYCSHRIIYVSPKGKKKCCECGKEFGFNEI